MSRSHIVCLLLALITLLVYLPVRHHEFLNYDDGGYVTENPMVQSGLTWAGVKWAFTTGELSNWHPLAWLSHMLDCQLFGLDAGSHHLVNVVYHAVNAVLLFLLLLRLTGAFWQSAFVAALFAWHPLRVESVAWVAERKDVLSAFFGLLALTAYVCHVEGRKQRAAAPAQAPDARAWTLGYALALVFFALGLMAKPMLVTLPLVLVLLDYWPLRRIPDIALWDRRWLALVREKWPFFALTAASCVVTFLAQQRGGAVTNLEWYPLQLRLENSVVSYASYLLKLVWPVDLAVIYPLPQEIPAGQILAAVATLAVISWLVWRFRHCCPYLLTGWLWFLVMLVPVIGLVQVGFQSMADRYTYLPLIGVVMGITFGIGDWVARSKFKPLMPMLMLAAGLVLAGCLAATARQLRFWQNSETLFAHSLAVTKDNSIARNGLGLAFLRQGRVHEAIVQIQKALEFRPRNIEALNNLAWVFATSPEASLRNGARAVELAERADQLSGGRNPAIIGTLAAAYAEAGRFPEAIAAAQRSLQLASVRNDLVRVTALQNRLDHYQAGLPFRDRNLTNRLPQSPAPLK